MPRKMSPKTMPDVEIRLSGSGGQGLLLSALILSEALILEGMQVAQSQAFEPLSRGGVSRSDLVVSEGAVDYPLVIELDVLLVLDQIAVEISRGMIKKGGLVVTDRIKVTSPPAGDFKLVSLPLTEKALALGNRRVANMLALGAIARITEICGLESLDRAVRKYAPAGYADISLEALNEGYADGNGACP